MEKFVQNGGLCHLAEAIFDYLPDKDLVNCLLVSKSWREFLTFSEFWRKRWVKKLDGVIANKYGRVHPIIFEGSSSVTCSAYFRPLFEVEPGWKEVFDYMKKEETLATFQLFVTRLYYLADSRYENRPIANAIADPDMGYDFIHLLLRSPVANKLDFSTALWDTCEHGSFAIIEMLLKYSDKTNIDVNIKKASVNTPLHMIAEDRRRGSEKYLKIMLSYAEKCGIDVHAKDDDGFTPFESMCYLYYGNGGYEERNCWSFKNSLDCWLDFPECFQSYVFEATPKGRLISLIVELYNEKLELGEGTEELNEKLRLPKGRKDPLTSRFRSLRSINALSGENLAQIVLELYQKRIEDYQRNKGSKKAKLSHSE